MENKQRLNMTCLQPFIPKINYAIEIKNQPPPPECAPQKSLTLIIAVKYAYFNHKKGNLLKWQALNKKVLYI